MSYIISYVTYAESTKEFPVQCYRTNFKSGDEVIVRRADGKLRHACITRLRYLNWDCSGRIECRRTESLVDNENNILLPKGALVYGICTPDIFFKTLRKIGWIQVKSNQRMYKAVLANLNNAHIAYIFIRKNGLDIRMFCRSENETIIPYSLYDRSSIDGKEVRHSLAHTTFNLYEGILRFSASFLNNERDLNRYFMPQGSSDKRTNEFKEQARNRKNNYEHYGVDAIGEYADDMLYGYHCR